MTMHSPNGPSSLRRRELCPASYWLEKDLPEQTNEHAEAGTRLHQLVADLLAASKEGARADILERYADLDAGQIEAASWCVDRVLEMAWPEARILTEHHLDLRWLDESISGGTADLVIVEDYVRAVVVDFKFGHTPVPPASENLQLACYAAGVAHEFDLALAEVHVCILQPALDRRDFDEFRPHTIQRALDAAKTALSAKGWPPRPGPEQCRYCKAAGRCPAQLALAEQAEPPPVRTKEDVELLPMQRISEFLAAYEDRGVEDLVGAMKRRLYEACLAGYEDERWGLGRGRGTREFREGSEAQLRGIFEAQGKPIEKLYTVPEPPQVKSPAQVEAVLGKGKSIKAALEPLIVKLEGRQKLERKSANAKDHVHDEGTGQLLAAAG